MAESWVELRVHGVSGTPPESMLDFDRVKQVGGDEFGRFFRRCDEHGEELFAPDGHIVEAYHWGKFTSGSWTKALWLLLAPFGIVNAAQFTLQPPTGKRAKFAHVVAGSMLRLVGLALTGLFVGVAAVITMDLWAWQKVGSTETSLNFVAIGLAGPLAVVVLFFFFGRARLSGSNDSVRGNPYVLVPLGSESEAVRQRQASLESIKDQPSFWSKEPPTDLTREGFFDGDPDVPALRWFHTAAGLALVATLGFAPVRERNGWTQAGFCTAVCLAGFVMLFVAVLGDPESSATVRLTSTGLTSMRRRIHDWARGVAWAAAGLGSVLTAIAVASLIGSSIVRPAPVLGAAVEHYPQIDDAMYVVMVLAGASMIVLALANVGLLVAERRSARDRRSDTPRQFRPFAGGFACTLLTSLGLFLGVGYAGAFGLAAAKAFGSVNSADDGGTSCCQDGESVETVVAVEATELLQRVVYAWGMTAVVIIGMVLCALARRCWVRKRLRTRVEVDFEEAGTELPNRWVRRAAGAIWVARLKNQLVIILATFAAVGIALTIATARELGPAWNDRPHDLGYGIGWLSASSSGGSLVAEFYLWLGGLTLTGLAAALLFLGRSAVLAESTRKSINVLWDVIAFWPRVAHPVVPPAYSQRSVADIRRRIAWHLDRLEEEGGKRNPTPADSVVLCAHSQGSLLSLAAIVSMRDSDELDRIGLLTFGSQIQVLFSRAFPAYVNFPTIQWMYQRLDRRWCNLYRDTDPLAGPVLSWDHVAGDGSFRAIDRWPDPSKARVGSRPAPGRQEFGPDWRLLDPPPPDRLLQQHPLDILRGHSDYWRDRAWKRAVTAALPPPSSDPDPERSGPPAESAAKSRPNPWTRVQDKVVAYRARHARSAGDPAAQRWHWLLRWLPRWLRRQP